MSAETGEALVRQWFDGKTEAEIEAMTDDIAKEAAKVVEIANVLLKLKQAEGSGLSHVVLSDKEIAALMRMLRSLTSIAKKK